MKTPALRLLACAALLAAAAAHAAPPDTRLAWRRDGQLHGVQRDASSPADASAWRTPLGSSWKLFMHAYLHANAVQEPAYRCVAGQRQPEEEYCCEPGESIGRDEALARSCGPYFDPKRLGVSEQDWQHYWKAQDAPAWLLRLSQLQPATELRVDDLLQAVARIPDAEKTAARQALMPLAVRDPSVAAAVGLGPRYKTWSWRINGERAGGAAGWLLDGSPFWFGAPGTSKTALQANARWIGEQLPATPPDAAAVAAQDCVEVSFFQRYPIRSVTRAGGGDSPDGPLSGRHRIAFENGSQLLVDAVPALLLRRDVDGPHISARLPLEDYVARVVDREGKARETQAARALAVASRSYVMQNGIPVEGCRAIADDSRLQRVSPNPPSAAARAAAAFTDGLVLAGANVRYHADTAADGVMSWQEAVAQGRAGMRFDAILAKAYPAATLAGRQANGDCDEMPQAALWLAQRQQRWRDTLRSQPGYEPVGAALRVCRLDSGTPHSDQRRLVIRVREWASREGRVTLIHEYLHLAFRHHPVGRDEAAIERLAQRLADS
ncbi:DUF2300 domain-containing protein [Roseateles sp.]|uniref:DUF2300 domain-containing protein n=1 Tax=Roseateles sp. TaxID=1971397 RepID=UPI003267F9F8